MAAEPNIPTHRYYAKQNHVKLAKNMVSKSMFSAEAISLIDGEVFSPVSIFANGEPGAWYDPSDLSTLFQDSAGLTPVTTDGQTVGRMLDKSGRGNHATQTTAASRPTYRTSGGLHWLEFGGTDDWLITPTITPGTDKAQVFAGVRKASDAAIGTIVELSPSSSANNGSLTLLGPSAAEAASYEGRSRGTTERRATAATGYAAPITNVVSFLADISGDSAILRLNGSQLPPQVNDQGTGNFLAYPLYIGRRNGGILPFNGRIYSLIVRFGPVLSAGVISDAESFVAEKTGVTL